MLRLLGKTQKPLLIFVKQNQLWFQKPDLGATQAYENDDVKRTELQSLRQKAVSMSVSEKAGANQIVKDWLGDTESEELESDSENQKEEE